MKILSYSHHQLQTAAKLTTKDIQEIQQRRRAHNRLGFAYQLAFIRLANRFPVQQPFELDEELLTFVSLQLDLPTQLIETYAQRQSMLSEHQEQIRIYLDLRRFGEVEIQMLERFLLKCGRGHCVATGDER